LFANRLRYLLTLIGGLFLLMMSNLFAQSRASPLQFDKIFQLQGEWNGSLLGPYLYLYALDDRSASSQHALEQLQQGHFVHSTQNRPNFGPSSQVHFAFFTINNPSPDNQTIVLENKFGVIDHFVLYKVEKGGLQQILHAGDQASFSERSYHERTINLELELKPGPHSFLIRTWGDTCVQLPLIVWKPKAFVQNSSSESLYIGILLGFHLVMIIYNFCLYLWIRQKTYLYYVLFVTANVVFHCSNLNLGQYLTYKTFGSEVYSNAIQLISVNMIIIFGLLFTRSYHEIDYRIKHRWIDRYLTVVIGVSLVDTIASFWLHHISSLVVLFNSVLSINGMIMIAWVSLKEGYQPARLFLVGWVFYLAGSYDVILVFLGYTEPTLISNWDQLIGGAIEVSLFSLALGSRYIAMQKSLYLSEKKNVEYQQSLSQELQTKFHLMSDLSHRINNPLNYISTHIAILKSDLKRLELKILKLLRDSIREEVPEEFAILTEFEQQLASLKDSAGNIDLGMIRTSATVREIRVLSGIDGYNRESCDLDMLLETCRQRVTEALGSPPQFTCLRSAAPGSKVHGNSVALQHAIVSIVSCLMKSGALDGPLFVDLVPDGISQNCLLLSAQKSSSYQLNWELEKALELSQHLLKPYFIGCEFSESGREILFEFRVIEIKAPLAA